MNTTRIVVIALVALILGILVGVGFQGSISQVLNLNAEKSANSGTSAATSSGSNLELMKAALLSNDTDPLYLYTNGRDGSGAGDGVILMHDSQEKKYPINGTYTIDWTFYGAVFTNCFIGEDESRITAIMNTGKPRIKATLTYLIELATQNKDDQLKRAIGLGGSDCNRGQIIGKTFAPTN